MALLLVGGQALCVWKGTDRFWPFSPMHVYTRAPSMAIEQNSCLVAFHGDKEQSVIALGWVPQQLERTMTGGLERTPPGAQRQALLGELAALMAARGAGYEGIRFYRQSWRMSTGEIVRRELLEEKRWP